MGGGEGGRTGRQGRQGRREGGRGKGRVEQVRSIGFLACTIDGMGRGRLRGQHDRESSFPGFSHQPKPELSGVQHTTTPASEPKLAATEPRTGHTCNTGRLLLGTRAQA